MVAALALQGCGTSAPAADPTAGATPALEERIAEHVEQWGGDEGQYRIILTLDECENLGWLGLGAQETMERLDDDGPTNRE